MFIGHFAVGLAAKSAAPKPSLGTYFIAAHLLDLLWPPLLLLGYERVEIDPGNTAVTPLAFVSYPWSHSLLMAVVFAAGYYAFRSDRKGALFLGMAVLSHWLLDFVTHRPDLPLAPGGSMLVGLKLWRSVPATMAVETVMFAVAAWMYMGSTRPKSRAGSVVSWVLLALLFITYLMNIFSPTPPPNPRILAWFSFGIWIYVILAYWGDGRRASRR